MVLSFALIVSCDQPDLNKLFMFITFQSGRPPAFSLVHHRLILHGAVFKEFYFDLLKLLVATATYIIVKNNHWIP